MKSTYAKPKLIQLDAVCTFNVSLIGFLSSITYLQTLRQIFVDSALSSFQYFLIGGDPGFLRITAMETLRFEIPLTIDTYAAYMLQDCFSNFS